MPLLDSNLCRRIYSQLTSNMMCGGYVYGGIDTCQVRTYFSLSYNESNCNAQVFFCLCNVYCSSLSPL